MKPNVVIQRKTGFTLVELVATLIILAVVSAVAIPRFFSNTVFGSRAYADQVAAMLRYAQKTAIAQRRPVWVNSNAAGTAICLTYAVDSGCTLANAVMSPENGSSSFVKNAPTGVTVSSSVSFNFSALGKPTPDAAVTMTVSGGGLSTDIIVERETGYVH